MSRSEKSTTTSFAMSTAFAEAATESPTSRRVQEQDQDQGHEQDHEQGQGQGKGKGQDGSCCRFMESSPSPARSRSPSSSPLNLNGLSQLCLAIAENWYFNTLIMLLIVSNSIILALFEPMKAEDSPRNQFISDSEIFFLAAFTIEMFIKMMAYGVGLNLGDKFSSCMRYVNRCGNCRGGDSDSSSKPSEQQSSRRPSSYREHGGSDLQLEDLANQNILNTNSSMNGATPQEMRDALQNFESRENQKVAYFKDGWNVLDFIVVVSGWISVLIDELGETSSSNVNFNVIRVVRVLRPLRVLKSIPGLSLLIGALLRSLNQLGNVAALSSFIYLFFGIIGVILFKGKLRQRCVDPETGFIPDEELEDGRFCSLNPDFGRTCPGNLICLPDAADNPGILSFDNVPIAVLNVFQATTLEGWSDKMYALMDTSPGWYVSIYFVLVVVIGAFFALNVLVAVVAVNYSIERELRDLKAELEKQDSYLNGSASPPNSPPSHGNANANTNANASVNPNAGATTPSIFSSNVEQRDGNLNAHTAREKMGLLKNPPPIIAMTEMRLMFSYEQNRGNPDYHVVTAKEYKAYRARNKKWYKIWKAVMAPRLTDNTTQNRQLRRSKNSGRVLGGGVGEATLESPNEEEEEEEEKEDIEDDEFQEILDSEDEQDEKDKEEEKVSGMPSYRNMDTDQGDSSRKQPQHTSSFPQTESFPRALNDSYPRALNERHNNTSSHTSSHTRGNTNQRRRKQKRKGKGCMGHLLANFCMEVSPCLLGNSASDIRPVLIPEGSRPDAPSWRRIAYQVVQHPWFERFILGIIVLNAIVLASQYFGEPTWLATLRDISNMVFVALFTLEMVVKIAGLGMSQYFRDQWNQFDALILLASLLDVMIPENTPILAAFRVFRILRVLRLVRAVKSLNRLFSTIAKSLKSVVPFALLLILFVYIFAVAGLYLFGGTFEIEEDDYDCSVSYPDYPHCPPRVHFDNFQWAFITAFQILTIEDWNSVMSIAIAANGWWALIYFLLALPLGSFIVLNLFLGVLVDAFIENKEEALARRTSTTKRSKSERILERLDRQSQRQSQSQELAEAQKEQEQEQGQEQGQGQGQRQEQGNTNRENESYRPRGDSNTQAQAEVVPEGTSNVLDEHIRKRQQQQQQHSNRKFEDHPSFSKRSLWCLDSSNTLRKHCGDIAVSQWFDYFIICVILVSCVLLALDSPDISSSRANALAICNLVITAIFVAEAVIKIVAFGLVGHHGSYLRDPWNQLDFLLVLVGLLGIAFSQVTSMRALRGLRALRPLRMIRRFESLRVIAVAMGIAIRPMLQVGAGVVLVFFIFAVLGVALFAGKIHACFECSGELKSTETGVLEDPSVYLSSCQRTIGIPERNFTEDMCRTYTQLGITEEDCPADSLRCSPGATGRNVAWRNPSYGWFGAGIPIHFDNVFMAMLTLFGISCQELWFDPMYVASDITEVGWNPVRGASDGNAWFFVIFFSVSQLLMLQLFVAVIVDSFQEGQAAIEGKAFLTESQLQWVELQRLAVTLSLKKMPLPPTNWRKKVYKLVTNQQFDRLVIAIILCNTFVLAMGHYNQSNSFTIFMRVADISFGLFYLGELILKLVGLGIRGYFSKKRNVFDFIIVLAILGDWIISAEPDSEGSIGQQATLFLQVIEALRIFRCGRIVQYNESIGNLLRTVLASIPAMGNIAALLFLVLFIFAAMGMSFFGEARSADPPYDFDFVNDYANFETFGLSLLMLFRCATGEEWNGVMAEYAAYNIVAIPYFVIFVLLVQFLIINLFVAVIMTDLESELARASREKGTGLSSVTPKMLSEYALAWRKLRFRYDKFKQDLRQIERKQLQEQSKQAKANNASSSASPNPPGPRESPSNLSKSAFPNSTPTSNSNSGPEVDSEADSRLYLPASYLPKLLLELRAPLGLKGVIGFKQADMIRLLRLLNVRVEKGRFIHYHTTLSTLIDRTVMNDTIGKFIRTGDAELSHRSQSGTGEASASVSPSGDEITPAVLEMLKLRMNKKADSAEKLFGSGMESFRSSSDESAVHVVASKRIVETAKDWLRGGKHRL